MAAGGATRSGARLLVDCLRAHGVEYVFGIPGAKVDAVFDALADVEDSGPRLILCRHEQNAAFMAGAIGRLTGRPGVVLVTSGPGVSNLTTGLATATTEGDPLVALGGAVARSMRLKQTHQSMDNVSLMKPVTKSAVELVVPESIPEVVENAFRLASRPRAGATFVSLPQDLLAAETETACLRVLPVPSMGVPDAGRITAAARKLERAACPVILLGLEASRPENAEAVRRLLARTAIATVGTYEAAGVVPRAQVDRFVGRVGLFRNQPGDRLLAEADVVLTVGFDPVEYDPSVWNAERSLEILHLDPNPADMDACYQPEVELVGDIAGGLDALSQALPPRASLQREDFVRGLQAELERDLARGATIEGSPLHPLRFIADLRSELGDDATVISDVGSHYMWLARHYLAHEPRHLLFSNGQQTLGVALPWAMAASWVRPGKPVVSISGDGGFLFSAMELETAVRERCRFVHCVWRDGSYNMVAGQQLMKYGREFGVRFGELDLVTFAQSFGATGLRVESASDWLPTLRSALAMDGPVLIDIPIDYSENASLFTTTNPHAGH